MEDPLAWRSFLLSYLAAHFDLDEVRTLCFQLGLDFDNLDGNSKTGRCRELILQLERSQRVPELLDVLGRLPGDRGQLDEIVRQYAAQAQRSPAPSDLDKASEPDVAEADYAAPGPVQLIDRDAELSLYRDRLARDRLVLISGIAGIGKTVLAASLAAEAAANGQHVFWFAFDRKGGNSIEGVWTPLAAFLARLGQPLLWRQLRAEADAQQSGTEVGQRTGILPHDRKLNLLFASLATVDAVICFDNLESVAGVPALAEFVEHLLDHVRADGPNGQCRFILVGRKVLAGLEPVARHDLAGLSFAGAQALAEARGHAGIGAEPLRRIWEWTGGNPELLLLAMSVLEPLAGTPAAARFMENLANQRDIRDYIMTHIFADLDPSEQGALKAVSALGAPVTTDQVEAVWALDGGTPALPVLDRLARKHLLDELEDGRFRCHALVAGFIDKILTSTERGDLNVRAAAVLERERSYLAAAAHLRAAREPEHALSLLIDQAAAIINGGGAATLAEQLRALYADGAAVGRRAELLMVLGDALTILGRYDEALDAYSDAKAVVAEPVMVASVLRRMGKVELLRGRFDMAVQRLEHSRRLSAEKGDIAAEAEVYHDLGWPYYRMGRHDQARQCFETCRRLAEAVPDPLLVAKAGTGLAMIELNDEHFLEAETLLIDSRRTFRVLEQPRLEAEAIGNLALWHLVRRELEEALRLFREAQAMIERVGVVDAQLVLYNNMGYVLSELGKQADAILFYERVSQLIEAVGDQRYPVYVHIGLADAYLAQGIIDRAVSEAQRALEAAEASGSPTHLGVAYRVVGEVALSSGDLPHATDAFETAVRLLADHDILLDGDLKKAEDGLAECRRLNVAAGEPTQD